MAKAHQPWKFWIGDTWGLLQTLCDDYDVPLDITDATDIEWILSDSTGLVNVATLNFANGGTYVIDGPTGLCYIHYRYDASAELDPGYYRDQTRLYVGLEPQVQIYGIINAVAALGRTSTRLAASTMAGAAAMATDSIQVGA